MINIFRKNIQYNDWFDNLWYKRASEDQYAELAQTLSNINPDDFKERLDNINLNQLDYIQAKETFYNIIRK